MFIVSFSLVLHEHIKFFENFLSLTQILILILYGKFFLRFTNY